jgi:monoamine oxidase
MATIERRPEMSNSILVTVLIVGGVVGIAVARRLHKAGVKCLIIEARSRLGGRAWTSAGPSGVGLDLGCGWRHSADRNPWVTIAQEQNRSIDKTPPPWRRGSLRLGFPEGGQQEFLEAQVQFSARVSERATREPDVAASTLLEPGNRWNNLINAVGTYISGTELDQVSALDFDNYDDTGRELARGRGLPAPRLPPAAKTCLLSLSCPVSRIEHHDKRLKIETSQGVIVAGSGDCHAANYGPRRERCIIRS